MEEDISNPQTGSTSVQDCVCGSLKLLVMDVTKPGCCWRLCKEDQGLLISAWSLCWNQIKVPSTSFCQPLEILPPSLSCHFLGRAWGKGAGLLGSGLSIKTSRPQAPAISACQCPVRHSFDLRRPKVAAIPPTLQLGNPRLQTCSCWLEALMILAQLSHQCYKQSNHSFWSFY